MKRVKGRNNAGENPFGFEEFNNFTNADYQNDGIYGEVDNTWKMGVLKKYSVFDKENKLIYSKEVSPKVETTI